MTGPPIETFGGDNFRENYQASVDTPQLAAGIVHSSLFLPIQNPKFSSLALTPYVRSYLITFSAHHSVFSFHRLVDKAVVEGLSYVELFGLGMVDEFQRIRDRLLYDPERGRKSVLIEFKAAL
jgi:hypothetical protein